MAAYVCKHGAWVRDGKVMLANDPDEFYVQAFAAREGAAGILD